MVLGARLGGAGGGIAGVICGTVLGGVIGRLPYDLSSWLIRRGLKRSSNRDLHDRIDREYYLSHLIIAELLSRGEEISALRGTVEAQLDSTSDEIRSAGQRNAKRWFPELIGEQR